MERVTGQPRRWPLHGVAATRAIEQAAQAGLPAHTLMQRAGLAVARLAMAVAPHARRVRIYCGPGNNGGDGLEAAMRLRQAGRLVDVVLLADVGRLPSDARTSWRRACDIGVSIRADLPEAAPLDGDDVLSIDALLGLGATRPAVGVLADAIARLQRGQVLAVDQPSGLSAADGRRLGDAVVRATHTLSLLTLKPGLFTAHGRDACGDVWFDGLGVGADAKQPDAWLAGGDAALQRRSSRHASHKGSFGDVQVLGGAPGMAGAAVLASRAALAAGAGRVYLTTLDPGFAMPDPAQPELMHRRPPGAISGSGATSAFDGGVVVAGCGGGDAVASHLEAVLGAADRVVLDADALNAVASTPALMDALRARSDAGRPTVLTPHPLEAARLLDVSAPEVQADRLGVAARLAERTGAVVVLKGSGTVVTGPGMIPSVNPTGNAALATAGTGDVLAGWLGGRWASADDGSMTTAYDTAVAAVYRHGLAAEGAVAPLLASRLIELMHALG